MLAGPLVSEILLRVRDPDAKLTSRDFVRARLSDAQRLVNARFAFLYDETTLVTEPLRLFYPLTALLPAATRPVFVTEGERNLVPIPWRSFWHLSRGWPRTVRNAFQLWSLIGRDLLVVWPAQRTSVNLTVKSAKLTTALDSDNDPLELADEVLPMVVDLATVLTLLKAREYGSMTEAVALWKARMKERATAA